MRICGQWTVLFCTRHATFALSCKSGVLKGATIQPDEYHSTTIDSSKGTSFELPKSSLLARKPSSLFDVNNKLSTWTSLGLLKKNNYHLWIKLCLLPVLDILANVDQTATAVLTALAPRLANAVLIADVVPTAIVVQVADVPVAHPLHADVVLIALVALHVQDDNDPAVTVAVLANALAKLDQVLLVVKLVAAHDSK